MFRKLLYNLNIIKKEHWVQPFIFVNVSLKPINDITGQIRWLDTIVCIKCRKKDYINKLRELQEKYENIDGGKYKGYVNFY